MEASRTQDPFLYFRRLRRARMFVHDNIDTPIGLVDVANEVGVSSSYFSRYFKSKVGVTFSFWLRGLRIKKAVSLLGQTNYSITEVCFAVGFNDLWTFQRAFRAVMGQTPSEYRENNRFVMQRKNRAERQMLRQMSKTEASWTNSVG